ncbi:MAG: fibronectin type III domain-containing protein [Bdellovibrionota bacterium]
MGGEDLGTELFFRQAPLRHNLQPQVEAGVTELNATAPVIKVTWVNPTYTAAEYTIQLEYKKASESVYETVDVGTETSHVITSDIDQTQDYNFKLKATTEDGDASEYGFANLTVGGGVRAHALSLQVFRLP